MHSQVGVNLIFERLSARLISTLHFLASFYKTAESFIIWCSGFCPLLSRRRKEAKRDYWLLVGAKYDINGFEKNHF